jgi:hypothetical protein
MLDAPQVELDRPGDAGMMLDDAGGCDMLHAFVCFGEPLTVLRATFLMLAATTCSAMTG